MAREFIDTNIAVYAFSLDQRSEIAERILQRRCLTSVQVLNEFANVGRRKLRMEWHEIDLGLKTLRILCGPVVPVDIDVHDQAFALCQTYNFSFYDALIVAAALNADCSILYSEDMQHGLRVDDRLNIVNPFLASATA